ncbi:EAL domain-containing protein, partial [Dialister hominis]
MFLQPLIEAQTGKLHGAEALARLRDDDGTIIPPGDFIELSNS